MRVVLFARHYPPAISGGARRPFLLAQGLRENGCDVFVVAPDPPPDGPGVGVAHPHRDPPLATTPNAAPTRMRDVAREWLFWPDPDIRWTRRAIAAAITALPFTPSLVITSSPPESVHWAGRALKQRYGCRWVADFRDEWLERPFRSVRKLGARAWMERRLARRLLTHADLVTCVDDMVARDLSSLAPPRRVRVLRQFVSPPPAPERFEGPGPHLVYTGSFSLSDPNCRIEPVLETFERASASLPDLRLHLAGRLTASELAAVELSPARRQILVHGLIPFERARALQAGADGLIVTGAPDATAVPGKVHEYRTVGAPIIAVGAGPWREIGDYEPGDPAERMRALAAPRPPRRQGEPPWTPGAAARALLDQLEQVDAAPASRETVRNDP